MSSFTEVIGWTLIHFVWQGSAIALVFAAALRILRRRSANARYLAACAGLAAMLTMPVGTAAWLQLTLSSGPDAVVTADPPAARATLLGANRGAGDAAPRRCPPHRRGPASPPSSPR